MTLGRKNNGFERKAASLPWSIWQWPSSICFLLVKAFLISRWYFFSAQTKGVGELFSTPNASSCSLLFMPSCARLNPMFKIIPLLSQNLTLSGIKNKLYFQITEKHFAASAFGQVVNIQDHCCGHCLIKVVWQSFELQNSINHTFTLHRPGETCRIKDQIVNTISRKEMNNNIPTMHRPAMVSLCRTMP